LVLTTTAKPPATTAFVSPGSSYAAMATPETKLRWDGTKEVAAYVMSAMAR
jgi:hypothetical protein